MAGAVITFDLRARQRETLIKLLKKENDIVYTDNNFDTRLFRNAKEQNSHNKNLLHMFEGEKIQITSNI